MDGSAVDRDQRVRLAAFQFLTEQTQLHGEVLPRGALAAGFAFDRVRVRPMGFQDVCRSAILPGIPVSTITGLMTAKRPRPGTNKERRGH